MNSFVADEDGWPVLSQFSLQRYRSSVALSDSKGLGFTVGSVGNLCSDPDFVQGLLQTIEALL